MYYTQPKAPDLLGGGGGEGASLLPEKRGSKGHTLLSLPAWTSLRDFKPLCRAFLSSWVPDDAGIKHTFSGMVVTITWAERKT